MKTLVVYDSTYGNTEKIARAIGIAIAGEVKVLRAIETDSEELNAIDILIIGSPTQGGRPTPAVQNFLEKISEPMIKGKKIAIFDTRFSRKWVGIFGYAAERIAENLRTKNGVLILPPEAFYVKGKKGPLQEGELERATNWAKRISE